MDAAGESLGVTGYLVEVEEVAKIDIPIPPMVGHVGFDGSEGFFVLIRHLHVGQDDPAGNLPLGLQRYAPSSKKIVKEAARFIIPDGLKCFDSVWRGLGYKTRLATFRTWNWLGG
jgi:hypothetical protein